MSPATRRPCMPPDAAAAVIDPNTAKFLPTTILTTVLYSAVAAAGVGGMEPSPLTHQPRPEVFQPKIVRLYEALLKVGLFPGFACDDGMVN